MKLTENRPPLTAGKIEISADPGTRVSRPPVYRHFVAAGFPPVCEILNRGSAAPPH